MNKHILKIKKEYADAYLHGLKDWELRRDDRNFEVGDCLSFTVIETNFKYELFIKYILHGPCYGLESGFCIMTVSTFQ
jgi:hypothetical protein